MMTEHAWISTSVQLKAISAAISVQTQTAVTSAAAQAESFCRWMEKLVTIPTHVLIITAVAVRFAILATTTRCVRVAMALRLISAMEVGVMMLTSANENTCKLKVSCLRQLL